MGDANGSGPGRPPHGGAPPSGPPAGPPPGPLSGPGAAPPGRRRWLLALIGVMVLAVGVAGLLVGTGAFGDDDPGGGATVSTTPPAPPASASRETPVRSPSAEPAAEGLLPFGTTHRYADGVEVTVSAPERFTPAEGAAGHKAENTAVKVDVTVRNGSGERLKLVTVQVQGRDGEGREAAGVFDAEQGILSLDGDLLPGRRAVAAYAFDVPPRSGDVLEVGVTVGFTGDEAQWSGPLP
ncbi:DUF4352 domain-containing protein [Streptomyces hydrogenans]|uniref:DUF4352 domain-containing protein n=1 Tax=Streptomyces hydrogenans TaxID=1873719 RepID=UPI0036E6D140